MSDTPDPADRPTFAEALQQAIEAKTGYWLDIADAIVAVADAELAAGLRVVPDDRPATCPHCNDDGVVHTHDGDVIGPCDCPNGDAGLVKDFLLRITPRSPESLAAALEAVDRLAARPVLEEDRREVEQLVAWLDEQRSWQPAYIEEYGGDGCELVQTPQAKRAAELLAAAYLGDTER